MLHYSIVIAGLMLTMSTSAEIIAKGASFAETKRAMRSHGYKASGLEWGTTGGKMKVWGFNGGCLIVNYESKTDKIFDIRYVLQSQGRKDKREDPISLDVISFVPKLGKMVINTRTPKKTLALERSIIAKRVSIVVASELMNAGGYAKGSTAEPGSQNRYFVWGVGKGLLMANYKEHDRLISALVYCLVLPGPEGTRCEVFDVTSFDVNSGEMALVCKKK